MWNQRDWGALHVAPERSQTRPSWGITYHKENIKLNGMRIGNRKKDEKNAREGRIRGWAKQLGLALFRSIELLTPNDC